MNKEQEFKNYITNSSSVKQICKRFNVELVSCNPDWRLRENFPFEHTFDVSDNFMGKLALLFGLKWVWNDGIGLDEIWRISANVNETTKFHKEGLKHIQENPMKLDKKTIADMLKGQKEQLKYQEQLTAKLRREIKILDKLRKLVVKDEKK